MKYAIDKELVCNGCKRLWYKCAKCTALTTQKKLGEYTWNDHKALNTAKLGRKKYVLRDSKCPGFVQR